MNEINIEELLQDYTLDESLFTEVSERLLDLNGEALTYAEKVLLVLYAEYQSYRKVADILGFSHSSVQRFINQIRKKLTSND